MPLYRLIIEGTGIRTPDGSTGFFTTRTVKQGTPETAERFALRALREEWRRGASATLSPTKPVLKVVDLWRIGLLGRLRRVSDSGHCLFARASRGNAARIEAAHAKAPEDAAIQVIAATALPEDEVTIWEKA